MINIRLSTILFLCVFGVTGQEDPFKNVHVKKAVYTSLSPSSPDSEPAISMDSLVKNGVYTVEPGDSVLVRCGATGNPKPLVMWRRVSLRLTKSCKIQFNEYTEYVTLL